jgi:hypothetical protein
MEEGPAARAGKQRGTGVHGFVEQQRSGLQEIEMDRWRERDRSRGDLWS